MSVRDLLSNHKSSVLFPAAPLVAASNVTAAVDLALGTTAMIHFGTPHLYSSTSTIDSIVLEYSNDATFPDSVDFPTVPDPLDPVTNLSTLGNQILNTYMGDFDFPREFTSTANIGQAWGLPFDLSSYAFNCTVNVLNPLGTYRYCRVRFTATVAGDQERLWGFGFVGPVHYKNSDGGIA